MLAWARGPAAPYGPLSARDALGRGCALGAPTRPRALPHPRAKVKVKLVEIGP